MSDSAAPREPWLVVLLLVFATLVWVPALGSGFTLDDRLIALTVGDNGLRHTRIAELQPLSTYFSTHYWADTSIADNLFRPFTTLSFALRAHFFGDSSVAAHTINVALHTAATGLVYALLRRLAFGALAALVGSALFAACAVHVEVVCGVVGRSELLAFVFGCSGALLSLSRGGTNGSRVILGVAAALCFFVAYGSKESAAAWLPFTFVLAWVLARVGKPTSRRWWSLALVTVVPLVVYLYLRDQMIAGLPEPASPPSWTANPIAHTDDAARMATGTVHLLHGLRLLIAPFGLSSDWGPHLLREHEATDLSAFAIGLLLAAIVFTSLGFARRAPRLFCSVAAFFGFSFVTSNIPFAIGTLFGERLLFSPSLMLALLAAVVFERAESWSTRGRNIARAVCAVAIVVQLGATEMRIPAWKDDATLVATDVARHPDSIRLQIAAATAAEARRDAQEAAERYQHVLEIEPQFRLAYINLASLALRTNKPDLAERLLKDAQMAKYGDDGDRAKIYGNFGLLRLMQKREAEAADAFAESFAEAPYLVQTFDHLLALKRRGVIDDARIGRVLDSFPNPAYRDAYRLLLAPSSTAQREGLRTADRALRAHPESVALRRRLRQRLAKLGGG